MGIALHYRAPVKQKKQSGLTPVKYGAKFRVQGSGFKVQDYVLYVFNVEYRSIYKD